MLLRVELKFDPKAYPLQAEALGGRIASHLLGRSAALRRLEREKQGELVVDLVSPGTLRDAGIDEERR